MTENTMSDASKRMRLRVLADFPREYAAPICTQTVRALQSDGQAGATILNTAMHVEWSMQCLAQALCLPGQFHTTTTGALRVYWRWIFAPAQRRPCAIEEDARGEQVYLRLMLQHLSLVFAGAERSAAFGNEAALSRLATHQRQEQQQQQQQPQQQQLIRQTSNAEQQHSTSELSQQNALSATSSLPDSEITRRIVQQASMVLEMFANIARLQSHLLTPRTWAVLLQLLIAIADVVLLPSHTHLFRTLGHSAPRVLFDAFVCSQTQSASLWKALGEFCLRHVDLPFVAAVHGAVSRGLLLRALQSPGESSDICVALQTSTPGSNKTGSSPGRSGAAAYRIVLSAQLSPTKAAALWFRMRKVLPLAICTNGATLHAAVESVGDQLICVAQAAVSSRSQQQHHRQQQQQQQQQQEWLHVLRALDVPFLTKVCRDTRFDGAQFDRARSAALGTLLMLCAPTCEAMRANDALRGRHTLTPAAAVAMRRASLKLLAQQGGTAHGVHTLAATAVNLLARSSSDADSGGKLSAAVQTLLLHGTALCTRVRGTLLEALLTPLRAVLLDAFAPPRLRRAATRVVAARPTVPGLRVLVQALEVECDPLNQQLLLWTLTHASHCCADTDRRGVQETQADLVRVVSQKLRTRAWDMGVNVTALDSVRALLPLLAQLSRVPALATSALAVELASLAHSTLDEYRSACESLPTAVQESAESLHGVFNSQMAQTVAQTAAVTAHTAVNGTVKGSVKGSATAGQRDHVATGTVARAATVADSPRDRLLSGDHSHSSDTATRRLVSASAVLCATLRCLRALVALHYNHSRECGTGRRRELLPRETTRRLVRAALEAARADLVTLGSDTTRRDEVEAAFRHAAVLASHAAERLVSGDEDDDDALSVSTVEESQTLPLLGTVTRVSQGVLQVRPTAGFDFRTEVQALLKEMSLPPTAQAQWRTLDALQQAHTQAADAVVFGAHSLGVPRAVLSLMTHGAAASDDDTDYSAELMLQTRDERDTSVLLAKSVVATPAGQAPLHDADECLQALRKQFPPRASVSDIDWVSIRQEEARDTLASLLRAMPLNDSDDDDDFAFDGDFECDMEEEWDDIMRAACETAAPTPDSASVSRLDALPSVFVQQLAQHGQALYEDVDTVLSELDGVSETDPIDTDTDIDTDDGATDRDDDEHVFDPLKARFLLQMGLLHERLPQSAAYAVNWLGAQRQRTRMEALMRHVDRRISLQLPCSVVVLRHNVEEDTSDDGFASRVEWLLRSFGDVADGRDESTLTQVATALARDRALFVNADVRNHSNKLPDDRAANKPWHSQRRIDSNDDEGRSATLSLDAVRHSLSRAWRKVDADLRDLCLVEFESSVWQSRETQAAAGLELLRRHLVRLHFVHGDECDIDEALAELDCPGSDEVPHVDIVVTPCCDDDADDVSNECLVRVRARPYLRALSQTRMLSEGRYYAHAHAQQRAWLTQTQRGLLWPHEDAAAESEWRSYARVESACAADMFRCTPDYNNNTSNNSNTSNNANSNNNNNHSSKGNEDTAGKKEAVGSDGSTAGGKSTRTRRTHGEIARQGDAALHDVVEFPALAFGPLAIARGAAPLRVPYDALPALLRATCVSLVDSMTRLCDAAPRELAHRERRTFLDYLLRNMRKWSANTGVGAACDFCGLSDTCSQGSSFSGDTAGSASAVSSPKGTSGATSGTWSALWSKLLLVPDTD